MDKNTVFSYSYSAIESKEVQNIRNKYLPNEENKLEELRKLDSRVQSSGVVEALTIGITGCLIFGVSMCIGLGAIRGGIILAVILGILGIAAMLPAYFVYRTKQNAAKEKYASRILELAEEIESENNKFKIER